jgi:hypothetical protein
VPTVEATITEVDQEKGWYRVHTDAPAVHLKKISTKKYENAAQAVPFKGQRALITYTTTERRDDAGKVWTNAYLESVEPAHGGLELSLATPVGAAIGEAAAAQPQIPQAAQPEISQAAQEYQRPMDPDTAWRVSLIAAAKIAVESLPYRAVEEREFSDQKQMAYAWARFFMYTPRPEEDDIPF